MTISFKCAVARFLVDSRGQSVQIGAILLFGIAIVAFASYQAAVVPDQTAEVEFEHYQEVRDEMTNVRSAIFQAKTSGQPQSTTVTLGTRYQTRIAAVNPPPASGTLESGEARNITVTEQDTGDQILLSQRFPGVRNESDTVTRFITYEPSYNEFNGAPIRYENSILYLDYRDESGQDGVVLQSDSQQLINDDTITLLPVQGEFRHSGVEAVSVEPIPGILQTTDIEDVNVTLPTELDEDTWEHVMRDELPPENVVVDEGAGEVTLVLDGSYEIEYAPVGLAGTPLSGSRGTGGLDINPAAPGDIRLEEEFLVDGTSSQIGLRFNNTADDNAFVRARINFYRAEEGSEHVPTHADVIRSGTTRATLEIRGDSRNLDPNVELTGESTSDVVLDFYNDDKTDPNLDRRSFFVFTGILETGEQATYFVSVPDEAGTVQEDEEEDEEEAELEFSYAEEPTSGGGGNSDLSFTVQNDGDELTLAGVEIQTDAATEYDDLFVSSPQGDRDNTNGPHPVGEEIEHGEYTIDTNEEATYDMEGFDANMNNRDVTIVLHTDDGRTFELPEENA